MRSILAAAPRDAGEIARVLGEAFHREPHMRGMLPSGDDADAQRRLTLFYRQQVDQQLRARQPIDIAVADGQILGAAVWQTPGAKEPRIGPRQALILLRAFGSALPRAASESRACAAARPAEPHWYLAAIGIASAARGSGIGRALIEHGLDRADRGGHGVHLEAATRDLVPLYERHGFIDRGDIASAVPANAVAMWRPAQSS